MFDSKANSIRRGVVNVNRVITEEVVAIKTAATGSWVCKAHDSHRHDFFINYRVSSEKVLATNLFIELNKRTRPDGKKVRAFMDAFCLRDGEPWQDGFLHGVVNSRVVVLLISEASLAGVKTAHERQDNVLLEYEHALAVLGKKGWGKMRIMPVFVGHHEVFTRPDGSTVRAYVKLPIPRMEEFPDAPHKCSTPAEGFVDKSVRETMRSIFALQGHFINPEERLDALYNDLMALLQG